MQNGLTANQTKYTKNHANFFWTNLFARRKVKIRNGTGGRTNRLLLVGNYVIAMTRAFINPERLTAQHFLKVLQEVRPRLEENYLKMLQANYSAPKRTITATQMAHALGYQGRQGANNYGNLAKMLCEELGYPKDHIPLYLLVSFSKLSGHWLWTMRPQVAEALEDLGLV